MRIESFRKAHAAKKLQRFFRTALTLRRRTRASLHFQAFRAVMLVAAFNYGAVKRDRAATCIKMFLSQKKGVDSVSRLIKNFRRRVGICQRRTLAWRAAKSAKLGLWRLQCIQAVQSGAADPSVAALLSSTSSKHARELVLHEQFALSKRAAVAQWDAYEQAVVEWEQHERDERAKASVLVEHVVQLRPRPVAPHVPPVLPPHTLAEVIDKLIARTREIARQQLQQTTDTTDLQVPAGGCAASGNSNSGGPVSGQSGSGGGNGGGGTGKPAGRHHRKQTTTMGGGGSSILSHTLSIALSPSPTNSRPASGQNAGRKK
jgi:uncharacterized membrane protein YgcG